MSTTRCVYCGRYSQKMIGNKCVDCLKEYREVREKLDNRTVQKVFYVDNILPFKVASK